MESITRRNDYIASIRSDMSDLDIRVRSLKAQMESAREIDELAKINKERKIRRMCRYEKRACKKQIKRLMRTRKELAKHLWMAENWVR